MKKKLKEIPLHNNEDAEREFWAENDSTEFVDWDNATCLINRLLNHFYKNVLTKN